MTQGVKTAFLADFFVCQTGAEKAIQRTPLPIGEQGVKQGRDIGLSGVKRRRQTADKNVKIRL